MTLNCFWSGHTLKTEKTFLILQGTRNEFLSTINSLGLLSLSYRENYL